MSINIDHQATNATIPDLYGDFSLNAANSIAANMFLDAGLGRLTPTHDLNVDQIIDLMLKLGREKKGLRKKCILLTLIFANFCDTYLSSGLIEPIIHQHLPIFHTEHCVFCRFLSNGNSYKDCGHPCETNDIELRDLDGHDHIVLADMGCRNTGF